MMKKNLFLIKKANLLCVIFAFMMVSVQARGDNKVPYEQSGTASFYNRKLNGRKTTSGERLNNAKYTAAHSSLPFGTMVRVTNQKNGKSVIVRINDRFSPRKGHLIDITYSAAKEIDMIAQGMARVRLEVLTLTESEVDSLAKVSFDTLKLGTSNPDVPAPEVKPSY